MTWHTNPTFLAMRNVARRAGLTKAIGLLRAKQRYEHAFEDAIFATLRPGDVVWDVGANVGYYTKRFAGSVSPSGKVIAFEPFPDTADQLRENLEGVDNYSLMRFALGAASGRVTMKQGDDSLGATNRIVEGFAQGVEIVIRTGDELVEEGCVEAPSVIKIDTEGFEYEVLLGIKALITLPKLRAIFIEVHFGLLADRGFPTAPAAIERELKAAGFSTRWVDPSHLAASRE